MRPGLLATAFCAVCATGVLAQQTPPVATGFVPSDELNKELPSWLRFSGEYRARVEGVTGAGFKPNADDAYLLSRLRLNMKISPTPWLRFNFQGQDARVFWKNQTPPAPPYQNTFDLRVAYVELGDSEKKSVGLRVGRQELAFGEQRLVGPANWLNTGRTFDAVRATFHKGNYRLDAFASSVVNTKDGEWDHHQQGNNFHGLYGGIEKLIPNAVIEPYAFWRTAPRQATESKTLGSLDSKTFGARVAGKLPYSFDYSVEMARQLGVIGTDDIQAWAGHWLVGYTATQVKKKPRFFAEYNYASGDANPTDKQRGTFDQLYPTGHDKWGLADQVGWRNIHDARVGGEVKPNAKLTFTSSYHNWWLASATDALYNAAGAAVVRVTSGVDGTHVGQELDAQGAYAFNKQVQFGMGFGHIFPGEFLKKATPGKSYNFPYFMAGYSF